MAEHDRGRPQPAPRADDGRDADTEGRVVILRGLVDDLEDSDALAEVAAVVTGVDQVQDRTDVRGL